MDKKTIFFSPDLFLFGILILLLVGHFLNLLPENFDTLLLLIFSLIGTLPVVLGAIRSFKDRKISIDLLASIALIASILAREWSSAVFINLMLTSARIFSRYTHNQARRALESLLKLRPEKVKIKRGEKIIEEPVEKLVIGDLIIIETGQRVPADCIIEDGQASVDQSSLTGESVPVSKQGGDKLLSSTLLVSGSVIAKAEKVGKETTLSKIIDLVEKAQQNKAGIDTLADKFASWYVIITLVGSMVIYYFSKDLILVLSVLLVACADDIAIAIPMGFLAAIGAAAKKGVIIKGASFLEGITKVKILLLDKTGTLTKGKLKVEKVVAFENYTEGDVLKYAAICEFFSTHPAAKAIDAHAKKRGIKFEKPDEFNEVPGKGITAVYKGRQMVTGKMSFIQELGIPVTNHQISDITDVKNGGINTTTVGYDGKIIGFLGLADELRPGIKEDLEELRARGIKKQVMLTGDNEKVAQRIAQELKIADYHANLLPEEKLEFVKKYLSKNYKVAMVGDGVNDAATLALADIGIAMGAIGSDAAIEASDIALMKDDFSQIAKVIGLGKYTMRIAYQDLVIWGVVNVIGFILVFGGYIGPQGASAYNFITDFLPFFNSLRLFRFHLRR